MASLSVVEVAAVRIHLKMTNLPDKMVLCSANKFMNLLALYSTDEEGLY